MSDVPAEAGPVRAGQELDWDALAGHLHASLGVTGPMNVAQFARGSANLTYLLTFGDQSFVLRRPPFGDVPAGANDMRREHRVLSRLWRAYARAPRCYLLCTDDSVIGSDFVVHEYRRGEVVWGELPDSMAAMRSAGRRIGLAVVDALAELHLVAPESVDLAQLGRPDGFMDRQLAGWHKRWDHVADETNDPAMQGLAQRLGSAAPAPSRPCVVHLDFKVDNCQFQPGEPDRVTSVFDWDMATLGEPLVDLGMLLNYWPDPVDTPDDRAIAPAGLDEIGLPARAEVVERYCDVTGTSPGSIAWYEAFATWRTAIVLQQLHHRYRSGDTSDERMATRALDVPMLIGRANRILDEARA